MKLFRKAIESRFPFVVECHRQGTTAYRLINGEAAGIPGLSVDRYGDVVVFLIREGEFFHSLAELRTEAEWLLEELTLKAIYLKRMISDRSHQLADDDMSSPIPIVGSPVPSEMAITEHNVSFLIRPFDGFSTGICLDQRDNRRFLGELSRGKKVLNLFAYTCGFSVVCAKGGAITTSIDISKKYLEWGKKNFDANGLPLEGHRFFKDDVMVFLKRELQRGNHYDLIILDPPSFGRGEKRAFSLKKDIAMLLRSCIELLEPGGKLFFSSNYFGWVKQDLVAQVEKTGLKMKNLEAPSIPRDFEKESNPIQYGFFERLP